MKNKKMIIGVVLVVAILASLAAVTFAADIPELEAWKAERLQEIRERLNVAVEDGRLTAEEADEFYAAREERIAACEGDGTCDGTGEGGIRQRLGDGSGAGLGRGGMGGGMGRGRGGMGGGGFGGHGACVTATP